MGVKQQPVLIKRYAGVAELTNWEGLDATVMNSILLCTSFSDAGFTATPKGTIARKPERRFAADLNINGVFTFSSGLVSLVERELETHGYNVQVEDCRQWKSKAVKQPVLPEGADNALKEKYAVVKDHYTGQIEVTGEKETEEWMAAIVKLFPWANVLVLVGSRELQKRLQAGLKANQQVQAKLGRANHGGKLLISLFPPGFFDPRHWHIVLLPDISGLVSDRGMGGMGTIPSPDWDEEAKRVYAFVDPRDKLSQRGAHRLHEVAGEVIHYRIPQHLQIFQHWIPANSPVGREHQSGLDFKRQAYYRNARRNDKVSAVARALAGRNFDYLMKQSLPPQDDSFWYFSRNPFPVAVLVENSEHASELCERLRGWKCRQLHSRSRPDAMRQIVTVSCAQQNGLETGALVVASGDPTRLNLTTGSLNRAGFPPELLVVDFEDLFHKHAAHQSATRQRNAARLGWLFP